MKKIKIKEGFTGQRSVELPKAIIDMQENDPLVSTLFVTYIGYYPKAHHHYVDRSIPITHYVLIYCVEGCGHYRVRNHDYTVKKNQYFILPANEQHIYYSDETNPWTIYWIHFSGALAPYYAEGAISPQSILPGLTSRINHRNEIFEEIFACLSQNEFSPDALKFSSSAFFYYLASMRFLKEYRASLGIDLHPSCKRTATLSPDEVVRLAQRYMGENIERHLDITAIADYIGYSTIHFTRTFKKITGETPLTAFNRMKVNYACHLLQTTDLQMNQICHKIGIDDSLYFSRLFKKFKNVSPSHFRNSHSGNNKSHFRE
ncbi:AraC family transcriptional regulator [Bacteroides uniformis]|jgi:transcriptional regulator|uniref:AraC family transcriptional regulator n=1 Tax=Bacteroides uniformis TaxID=820 RepID=A0A1Y3V8M5_BACUN|nr:helix-turn-helix domain-containing protein [Bacteroides uniformis]KAB4187062.1 AraC family transcriptional regulator [Bacteroides uniformis]MUT99772.1 AraC family transcriptional regulator [Bacteroides uniformis]OUN55728.1 hypothetical protein B5G17_08560 [Bacteroides uniformis]